MSIAGKIIVRRASRAARVANRARRRALEREMACYASAAERADLEATFDRYPDHVTQEMRDILAVQHSVVRAHAHDVPRRRRDG